MDIELKQKKRKNNNNLIHAIQDLQRIEVLNPKSFYIERLIKRGSEVNIEDEFGQTALMWAVLTEDIDIVKAVLPNVNQNNFNKTDSSGRTALMLAAMHDFKEMVEAFTAKFGLEGLNKQDKDGKTSLMLAAERGGGNVVSFLVARCKKGVAFDTVDNTGKTALILAAMNGHNDAVFLLRGALNDNSYKIKDKLGRTAIMWAGIKAHQEILNTLRLFYTVEDWWMVDKSGRNILMHVAVYGYVQVVEFLKVHMHQLEYLEMKTPGGKTALELAKQRGHENIVKILERQFKSLREQTDKKSYIHTKPGAQCHSKIVNDSLAPLYAALSLSPPSFTSSYNALITSNLPFSYTEGGNQETQKKSKNSNKIP